MKKLLLAVLTTVATSVVFADNIPANTNSTVINPQAYLQNPWNGVIQAGGTKIADESADSSKSIGYRLLNDGTYTIYSGVASNNLGINPNPNTNTAVGTNLFAQTGQINGFSAGTVLSVFNPFNTGPTWNGIYGYGAYANNATTQGNSFGPAAQNYVLPEAFVEYQNGNNLNVDAGLISINNSPWIANNYIGNMVSIPITVQGVAANAYLGNGWMLTGIGFSGALLDGQGSLSNRTLYNNNYNPYDPNNIFNNGSTAAFGANYVGLNNNYNARIWAYNYQNYGSMIYADNNLKLPVNKDLSFNLAAQGGTTYGVNSSIGQAINTDINAGFHDNVNTSSTSQFAGVQAGVTYDALGLNLSANNVWGGSAIIAPYTGSLQVDPIYSEGWNINMVGDHYNGTNFKIAPSLTLLDGNLSISPSYVWVSNATQNTTGASETDFIVTYNVPQVKGLSFFGMVGGWYNPNANTTTTSTITTGQTNELAVFYTY